LGVYSGDLAYYSLNKQKQEAINCLNTIRKISGGIGLETIFGNKELLESFEKNIDNEDSLAYVIAEIQMELDSYLSDNEMNHLSSVIFASAWIESMYLGSKSINAKNKQAISNQLSQQYLILEKLTKALNKAAQVNAGFAPLANEISAVNDLFNSFEYLKNKDTEEVTSTITDEELNKLTAKIEEIRKKLIEGAIS
jgi:valyl-tRNA synthetase